MIAVNLTFLPSINPPPYMEYAKVIIEEGIKVVETAGSAAAGEPRSALTKVLVGSNTLPKAPCIAEFKKAGIYVIHKCTTGKSSLLPKPPCVD
jgi:NAD(P)H-dependent flavin oxidoreductase YrpB (nitropropane dioxygenase family)